MQKNAVTVVLSTLVMGVFGAFLRWLQNTNIYEADTGLVISHSGISTVLVLYSLAVLAAQIWIAAVWLRDAGTPAMGDGAFHTDSVIPTVIGWCCCAVFGVAGVLLMFSAGSTEMYIMQRLLGAFCIVAGVCFPFLPSRGSYEGAGQSGRKVISCLITVFFCFWLVFSYRSRAQVPSLWTYAPEIVAITGGTMSFYYLTAWPFGRGRRRRTLATLQFASYLNIMVLPDSRTTAITLLLTGTAVMLLTLEYLMLRNMLGENPAGEKSPA